MVNSNDIVSGVLVRLGATNIPSEITTAHIIDLANDRVEDINTLTGQTISGNDIPRQFVSPLKDLVTADVVARMLGIDIDTEISVGNIRLAYRDINVAEQKQIEYFLQRAEKSLNMTGRRITFGYTNKAF